VKIPTKFKSVKWTVDESSVLSAALSASIKGKIAFGPRAGQNVRFIGEGFGFQEGALCKVLKIMSPEMDLPVMASHQLDTEFCADGGLVNERRETRMRSIRIPRGTISVKRKQGVSKPQ
jgi:hypothetical protein